MTSNSKTVSRQKTLSRQHGKIYDIREYNKALLPLNVHRRPPLQQGLMNFQLQSFQLYNKSLNIQSDWSLRKQFILFSSNLNVFHWESRETEFTVFSSAFLASGLLAFQLCFFFPNLWVNHLYKSKDISYANVVTLEFQLLR